jgi:putative nucleotidyltransferase with HDIG domain
VSAELERRVVDVSADVARATLVSLPAELRTVAAELIVREMLDRVGDALARADVAHLELWLEQTYERHASMGDLSAVLQTAALTLMHAGRGEGWLREHDLAPVTRAISRSLTRPREMHSDAGNEPIDEIDVIISDLIARLFEKDVLTGEHSRAVALWCLRLARNLGLSMDDAQLVQRGGLLHDIGKIATPDEILNAPRRLTQVERLTIERHPADGAEIVVDIPQLTELLPMVRSHHERIDGRGYPDGLRGEEIPLTARIVSVADSFNAMVGRRPYRPPLAPSLALEELRRHSGSQFDPEVVAAMEAVVASRGERL